MTAETGDSKPGAGGADQRPTATLDLKAKEIFPETPPASSGPQAALPPGGPAAPEPIADIPPPPPETPAEQDAPHGGGSGSFLSHLAASVAGAALALIGAYLLGQSQGGSNADVQRALAEAQQRIAAVEEATRATRSERDGAEMRLTTVMEQANALKQETAALGGRVKSVEARPVETGGGGLSPESLQQSLAPLATKIGEMEGRFAALAKSQEELRSSTGAAALTMAVQNLRRAVADGKPFATELKTLASLTPEPLEVGPLEARRESGLASLAKLQHDFDLSAKAAIDAARPNGDGSFTGDLLARARSLVRVRPTGDIPGDAPEAILARAEHRLDSGDLPAAINETGRLAGPAAQAMTPWLTEAKAKAAAEEALARIEAKLMTSLGSGEGARRGG